MNPVPVLTLLGVTLLLPYVSALSCRKGTIEAVRNVSELPLKWTTGTKICDVGEGCQDMVMLIENGPQIKLLIVKDCIKAEDQGPRITYHRTGPGLSVISYTHVCRHSDFCNDLSTTQVLGDLPTPSVPGTLRCPLCLSEDSCANAPEQVCPAGSAHCYSGVLRLRGGEITTNLKVRGCMAQPGCNLLNGTQTIGVVDVSENCDPQLDTLTCHKGVMLRFGQHLAGETVQWTTPGTLQCNAGEVCQETLLLIDVGQRSLLVGSKGCSKSGERKTSVSVYSQNPGMVVTSYSRFCSSDLCNNASSSDVLQGAVPSLAPAPPGDLQCPVCLEFSGSCYRNTNLVTCPQGTSHCYNGELELGGGGLSAGFSIRGCMASSSKTLLKNSNAIGIFLAKESTNKDKRNDESESPPLSGGARVSFLAWALGLGLSLALYPLC